MKLLRAFEALVHGGKIILTGTGIEPQKGGKITVTGRGVANEWVLVSEQYPWLKFFEDDQPCYCVEFEALHLPCPNYPHKDFYAIWEGTFLSVYWLPVWDFNDDGKVNLSDLCYFAVGYVQGKWTLADFARFADLFHRPAVYRWLYRKA